jgi:hypothetical protein
VTSIFANSPNLGIERGRVTGGGKRVPRLDRRLRISEKETSLPSSLSSHDPDGRLAPLGTQRLRLWSCLGGDLSLLPGTYDPKQQEDVFAAFRAVVEHAVRRTHAATDALTRSLVGAGRLLTGDLSGGIEIIEHLPAEPPVLDHGAGYCLVASVQALEAALPTLPRELAETSRWLAGSREQTALREWLARHRATLDWDELRAVYVPRASDEPAGDVGPTSP